MPLSEGSPLILTALTAFLTAAHISVETGAALSYMTCPCVHQMPHES